MGELKPCPKCKGKHSIFLDRYLTPDGWQMMCYMCNFRTKVCKTKEKAIEAWNRKASDGNG